MKKDKLYTVNKYNQTQFARNVDRVNNNIFDGMDNSFMSYNPNIPQYNPYSLAFPGQNSRSDFSPSYDRFADPNPLLNTINRNNFGISIPSIGTASKIVSSTPPLQRVATSAIPKGMSTGVKAGIGAAGALVGQVGHRLISNGFDSGGVGDGIANIGGAVGGIVGTFNPVLGAAISAGTGLIGGVVNRGFGVKKNDKNIARVDNSVSSMRNAGNLLANAATTEDLINRVGNVDTGFGFKNGFIAKNGWFNHKGDRLANKYRNKMDTARGFLAHGIETGEKHLDRMNDDNAFINSAAFGGLLDSPSGAIDYGLALDYLNNKRMQYEVGNKISGVSTLPNDYCGGGRLFALGGDEDDSTIGRLGRGWYDNTIGAAVDLGRAIFGNNGGNFGGGTFTGAGEGGDFGREYNPSHRSNSFKGIAWPYVKDTFNEAFKRAREKGKKTFKFNGKTYSTKLDTSGNPERARKNNEAAKKRVEYGLAGAGKWAHGYGGTLFDLGGDLQTHGADWSTGSSHIDAGGTHEENPYQGVQVGVDPQGTPNLVEEGEVIYNDYVYSKRILCDDETKEKFHISKKREITFADLAKKLEKEISERPNDPISKAGFDRQMAELAEEQERQKQEMQAEEAREAFDALSPEEQVAVMQQADAQAQEEQQMQEQPLVDRAMAEQQMAGPQDTMMQGYMPSPEQMMQQQMIQQQSAVSPQGLPMIGYAYGGNLFAGGGVKEDVIRTWLNHKYPNMSPAEIADASYIMYRMMKKFEDNGIDINDPNVDYYSFAYNRYRKDYNKLHPITELNKSAVKWWLRNKRPELSDRDLNIYANGLLKWVEQDKEFYNSEGNYNLDRAYKDFTSTINRDAAFAKMVNIAQASKPAQKQQLAPRATTTVTPSTPAPAEEKAPVVKQEQQTKPVSQSPVVKSTAVNTNKSTAKPKPVKTSNNPTVVNNISAIAPANNIDQMAIFSLADEYLKAHPEISAEQRDAVKESLIRMAASQGISNPTDGIFDSYLKELYASGLSNSADPRANTFENAINWVKKEHPEVSNPEVAASQLVDLVKNDEQGSSIYPFVWNNVDTSATSPQPVTSEGVVNQGSTAVTPTSIPTQSTSPIPATTGSVASSANATETDPDLIKNSILNTLGVGTWGDFTSWLDKNGVNKALWEGRNTDNFDWSALMSDPTFREALAKDNSALAHSMGLGYDFGKYKPGPNGVSIQDVAHGNWNTSGSRSGRGIPGLIAGWKDSQDDMWKEVGSRITPEMSLKEVEEVLRNSDAWNKTTNWLKEDPANILAYYQAAWDDTNTPSKARDFIKETTVLGDDSKLKWKEGFKPTYDNTIKREREHYPGTFWHSHSMNDRQKKVRNFVKNAKGEWEDYLLNDIPEEWGDPYKTYQWAGQDDNTDWTTNYYLTKEQKAELEKAKAKEAAKSGKAAKGKEDEFLPKPHYRSEWPRYAGLFGPAVGLGMMAAGIGKPDTSSIDAVMELAGRGPALATMQPIGNRIAYNPMDRTQGANSLMASSRGADRSILNSGSGSNVAANLLANAYNRNIGLGDMYRKGDEYNDALQKQVGEFNRGTDQYNATAFNQLSATNAELLNRDKQFRAGLQLQAANEKMDADAGWYNSLYGNVAGLFKGIGDLGRENAQHNMLAELAADGVFGVMSNRTNTGRKGRYIDWVSNPKYQAAEGGELNRKKNKKNRRGGLTF